MNLYVEEKELKDIEKSIYKFIWGGPKKAKIKKEVLMAPVKYGGLNAPDLLAQNSAWKWSWLCRLQENPHAKWCSLVRQEIEKCGGVEYLLKCNFQTKTLGLEIRTFWQEVLQTHATGHNNQSIGSITKIKDQIINNNQYILVGGKSLFKKKLIENETDILGNWVHWNGKVKSFEEIKRSCPRLTWLEYHQIWSAVPRD